MANWCSNTVVFEGNEQAIKLIQQLFKTMKEKEEKTEEGQVPDLITDKNGGYCFNSYWNEEDTGIFQYETKWSSNLEIVQKIAAYYKVQFVQDCEERGKLVYGRATVTDKLLTYILLEVEDFERFQLDQETDSYPFEGKEYDNEWEILETLLEQQLANH